MAKADDEQLRGRFADLLSKDPASLPAKFESVVADSFRAAANDVTGLLLARGFSAGQVAAWDRSAEYVLDIGLFWCLTKAGLLGNYSDLFVAKLDRRKELLTTPVMVGGVLVSPGSSADGFGVGGGRLGESTYRITMDTEF